MKIQKIINVDLNKSAFSCPIRVVQYDTGIQLILNIVDFEIPSGTTAIVNFVKPSGNFVYQEDNISISDNSIIVDVHNQAFTEYGRVNYQVELKNGSDIISTFSRIVEVEKSLSNSGGEKSETVIRVFEELTAEKIAEIEASTLAFAESAKQNILNSIPGDYTEMSNNVDYLFNKVANAIKKEVSGSVVAVKDVSVIEHNPTINVHGKNLFNNSSIEQIISNYAKPSTIDTGVRSTIISAGTWRYTLIKAMSTKSMVGKTLTLSYTAIASADNTPRVAFGFTDTDGHIRVQKSISLDYSDELTITVTEQDSKDYEYIGIWLYANHTGTGNENDYIDYTNLQVEIGDTATTYAPWVDPTTVSVKRCGKNLIPYPYNEMTLTRAGVTFTVASNGMIIASGTSTGAYLLMVTTANKKIYLHKGQKYFFSGVPSGGGYNTYYGYVAEDEGETFFDLGSGVVITPTKSGYASVTIVIKDGTNVSDVVFKPVLEVGEIKTGFEMYNGAEYTPNVDGTVDLMSISPNMSIFTDTDGIIVDCEYNVDTKKYLNRLSGGSARIGNVNLMASKWVGNASPYSQVVSIDGVTENTQVDLTPSVAQLAVFYEKDLGFVTENVNGVVTVYAIGQKPTNDYIIQVTLTEVDYE